MRFVAIAAVLLLPLLAPVGAFAQGAGNVLATAGDTLRAGQFTWFEQPELIRAGIRTGEDAISIVISIPSQRAYVYRGARLVGVSTVSTGSRGNDTPVGEFTILEKKTFHRSNLYSNAPMPFMQRLTWTGIALHAGHLPGYPASHGCIRLPHAFARALFELTEKGGQVSVIDSEVIELPPADTVPRPQLIADAHDLGGDAFNMVTMRDDRPPLLPVKAGSWVTGPVREIVQPVPGAGSR